MFSKKFNKKTTEKRPRMNMQIKVPQVQLIDETGKQLGVIETSKAIRLAYEKELDLVEVGSHVSPPVAKIMDFGKFMYQKEKKSKGIKKTPAQEMKTVKIGVHTGEHDLSVKAKQIDKFLKKGYPVRIEMFLRGREKALKWLAKEKIANFPNYISEKFDMEGEIKSSPSGFFMITRPSK